MRAALMNGVVFKMQYRCWARSTCAALKVAASFTLAGVPCGERGPYDAVGEWKTPVVWQLVSVLSHLPFSGLLVSMWNRMNSGG